MLERANVVEQTNKQKCKVWLHQAARWNLEKLSMGTIRRLASLEKLTARLGGYAPALASV